MNPFYFVRKNNVTLVWAKHYKSKALLIEAVMDLRSLYGKVRIQQGKTRKVSFSRRVKVWQGERVMV